MLKNSLRLLVPALMMAACGSPSGDQGKEMDRETRIKFDKYLIEGKELYTIYCTSCHQSKGEGLARLYPPLAQSDYLLEDVGRTACIIKNGQFQEIQVNGVTYNQMMPDFRQLSALEIAEILTYITNSWGNAEGIQEVAQVEKWLAQCPED